MSEKTSSAILILVDGTCIFCNRLVAFILRKDKQGVFRFAHLQGALARAVLDRHGLVPNIDLIYAISDYGGANEHVHVDGAAGRLIWPRLFWFGWLLYLVPLFVLNLQYQLLAKVRYRLFGQANACVMPSAQERLRFLD
jgi:predicted DCC family thiol-disulfide oxidoreductase YuxK